MGGGLVAEGGGGEEEIRGGEAQAGDLTAWLCEPGRPVAGRHHCWLCISAGMACCSNLLHQHRL